MPEFIWTQLREITGGEWLIPPRADTVGVDGIHDDSRALTPGALFIAIQGNLVDGHRFISKAVQNGAGAVCLQTARTSESQLRALHEKKVPTLAVPDSLNAYHDLARAWRRQCRQATVIGLTGSSGKTSLRAILESILRTVHGDRVLATEGNTNNEFGVPRNLLRLTPEHRVAVIEVGTNDPGEIARLAAVVEPDIAAITTIGRAHLEFFGTLEAIAREKSDLIKALPATGIAILPDRCPGNDILKKAAGNRRTVVFGETADADVRVEYLGRAEGAAYAVKFTSKAVDLPNPVEWPVGGRHQALNAAAAVSVARAAGVGADEIVRGLQQTRLPGMRMQVTETNGINWVNDAYNANPDSMRAAIEWFAEMTEEAEDARRWLVLGDMLELGAAAPREHASILQWATERMPYASIIPVGSEMTVAAAKLDLKAYPDAAAATAALSKLSPGDWVLLKASRGIHLEEMLPQ